MNTFIKKNQIYLQMFFKAMFLIHLLFCYNAYIVGTLISKIITVVAVVSGALLLLTRLTELKKILFSFEGAMLLLFMASYLVSVVLNIQYGYYEGLKYFIWLILLLGGVFWTNRDATHEQVRREIFFLCIILIGYAVVMNCISLGLLFARYSGFYNAADGRIYLIGFAYWGRLYGVYVDPNYGAVVSGAAILAACFCLTYVKKAWIRVLFVLSMIPSILNCAFSASRTGLVSLGIGGAAFLFAYVWRKGKKHHVLKALGAAVCGLMAVIIILTGTVSGYNKLMAGLASGSEKLEDTEKKQQELIIGRQTELNGDISNRRFDIWKSGWDIFKQKPVFGVGWGNNVEYVKQNIPDSYLINNDLATFDVFHNSFIDILVDQGIVGIVITLVFMGGVIVMLIKTFRRREYDAGVMALLFGGVAMLGFSGCVLSVLVYVNCGLSYLFWLFLGYLVYFCRRGDQEKGLVKE